MVSYEGQSIIGVYDDHYGHSQYVGCKNVRDSDYGLVTAVGPGG